MVDEPTRRYNLGKKGGSKGRNHAKPDWRPVVIIRECRGEKRRAREKKGGGGAAEKKDDNETGGRNDHQEIRGVIDVTVSF